MLTSTVCSSPRLDPWVITALLIAFKPAPVLQVEAEVKGNSLIHVCECRLFAVLAQSAPGYLPEL